jgi:cytochrome c-type biogenesis protein CcmH/NrfG
VNLEPSNGQLYWVLAEVLNNAGRHEEALDAIRKAIRLNPHYPARLARMIHEFAS